MSEPRERQPVRSYVLRAGRMTPAQKRAFDRDWARWGLRVEDGPLDAGGSFGRVGPLILEIGFGMGLSLVEMAQAQPEANYVGIEVHRPGVGKLLHAMGDLGVDNIRIYCHDAVEVLERCISDNTLDAIQIFFPDPWHKKRHHKRRLIQPAFVAELVKRLKPGGTLHLATDWENYAQQMMEVLSAESGLRNSCPDGEFTPRPAHRPLTKFERRGELLGHGVRDLVFRKRSSH